MVSVVTRFIFNLARFLNGVLFFGYFLQVSLLLLYNILIEQVCTGSRREGKASHFEGRDFTDRKTIRL